MAYVLPLEKRRRLAGDKRRRYWANPDERLKRINEARKYRGADPINSLDEMGDPRLGRRGADRGSDGRFVST